MRENILDGGLLSKMTLKTIEDYPRQKSNHSRPNGRTDVADRNLMTSIRKCLQINRKTTTLSNKLENCIQSINSLQK